MNNCRMLRDGFRPNPWYRIFLLFLYLIAGCGQKPTSDSWVQRPGEEKRAEPTVPLAGASYDLSKDQDRGGHTLGKHVGRTDDELRQRLQHQRNISAASTWTDRRAAEQTVGAALQAERGKIENWERRGERRPNLALHFDAGREIGRSLIRGADRAVPCTQAVIVLHADGGGFYVLTTYPEAQE
jgi:Bacterial CdiA-CT RNAse A domain